LKLTDVSEVCIASIIIALMMEPVHTSETSVNNVTTRRYTQKLLNVMIEELRLGGMPDTAPANA
jgi:hypothetical protein